MSPGPAPRRTPRPTEAVGSAQVGPTLRSLRTAAGMSMVELARRAGVTQPFVSQVEGGSATPSLATLYRFAQALDVAPTALFPPAGPGALTVVRAGSGATFPNTGSDAAPVGRVLTSGGMHLEVIEYQLEPGVVDETSFSHPGEELVYVLEGKIELFLDDGAGVVLAPGDSAHFDASRAHRFAAYGLDHSRHLLVAAYPHRGSGTAVTST
ncbi:MAG TPA: XRE family transcriptional regulator [Pseudonocardia sp.]|uniref:helix-turn-helix domain-containing protein n=1 Tax=Pseudonocardia sp. TaxID=60912 RepID=UPI002CFFD063|nr:XRE family transcriptional regulator [Pseudonocardia sp.]HTF52835.1 XRE family transcriptional regulator [Pseudonocardia sp.]